MTGPGSIPAFRAKLKVLFQQVGSPSWTELEQAWAREGSAGGPLGLGKTAYYELVGPRKASRPEWPTVVGFLEACELFYKVHPDRALRFGQWPPSFHPGDWEPEYPGQVPPWPPRAIGERTTAAAAPAPAPAPAPIVGVPSLPEATVQRVALTEQVVRLLTRQDAVDVGGVESMVGISTALRGAGGFGKTRLATLVCHRNDIRQHFRDGIVWVTLGEHVAGAELAARANNLCWQLTGVRPPLADPIMAGAELSRAFAGRRMLLVIDDVWFPSQLEPFLDVGAGVTRLVTTRQRSTLPKGTVAIDVDAMRDQEARQLLTEGLGSVPSHLLNKVLNATGRWPFLVSLVNGAAGADVAIGGNAVDSLTAILQELLVHGPAALYDANAEQRNVSVRAMLNVSLNRLTPDQADRYGELAVFPDDTDIPGPVLERYWAATAGWTPFRTNQFCRQLADMSLAQEYRLDPPRLRLHDVIRGYLINQAGDDLPRRHAALLDAQRPLTELSTNRSAAKRYGQAAVREASTKWYQLPTTEQYLWMWIAYHLHLAGRDDELTDCLHSANYVAAKLNRTGPAALETELGYLQDTMSVELRTNIRQSAHLLSPLRPIGSLEATLASRLAGRPALNSLAARLLELVPGAALYPYAQLPDTPDSSLRRVLTGNTDWVRALAVAPDGSWLASAGDDGTVRLWDPATGTQTHTLTGHTHRVQALAAAPDGSWLASASGDGTVRLWDPATGTQTHTLTGHTDWVQALAAPLDGSWLASAGDDRTVRLWDPATGTQTHTLTGHTDWVQVLAAAPDGSWLASASGDGTVRLWDPATGTQTHTLTGHTDWVQALATPLDGSWLASAGDDRTVRLWDPATGTQTHTLTGHTGRVQALAAAPDGSWLATAGDDATVRLWDPATGAQIHTLTGHTHWVQALAAAPDGSWLASASGDRTVRLWDPATGTETHALTGHTGRVQALAAPLDGSWLASSGDDGTVRLWDPVVGTETHLPTGYTGRVEVLAAPLDGSWLASAGGDGTVRLWDPATGTQTHTLTGHTDWVQALAAPLDGSWLASAGRDGTVRLWDPATGTQIHTLIGHTDWVQVLAAAPDGSWLASASGDGTVRLWDPATGTQIHALTGHTGRVQALAAPLDGSWLASAGRDGTVQLWDPATGTQTHTLIGHTDWVQALAAPLDGSWLASAGSDGTVQLWDPATGTETHGLTALSYWVQALAVAPDGSWLASAGDDGTVWLWDPAAGTETHTVTGHTGRVRALAVAPDGSWLASAGDDGTVRLWDPVALGEIAALRVGAALHILCPAGNGLVAAGASGLYWLRWRAPVPLSE